MFVIFFFFFQKESLANRIKSLRAERGISQKVLYEGLGISKTQISDIENAKVSTSIERLYALADYFDVSMDYLVGRTDKPEINR